jgi:hypothetical protein
VTLASFEAIVRALNEAGVRYLVAGGLAVNAQGYLRFTKDADVVIQLVPDNIKRAFAALAALGYKPLAPVICRSSHARGLDTRQRHAGVATLERPPP